MSLIARALQVSRSNLMRPAATQPRRQRQSKDGPAVLDAVKAIVGGRPSYGYRRTTALLNRQRRLEGKAAVNHKRIYRLMAANQLLLERHTGKPMRTHEGKVVTLKSDLRWCSTPWRCGAGTGRRYTSPSSWTAATVKSSRFGPVICTQRVKRRVT